MKYKTFSFGDFIDGIKTVNEFIEANPSYQIHSWKFAVLLGGREKYVVLLENTKAKKEIING